MFVSRVCVYDVVSIEKMIEVCLTSAEAGLGPLYFYSFIIQNNQRHGFDVCKFM